MRAFWTDDQLETLRINYADWPTYLVAFVCGHPEKSTYCKARELGLKKSAAYLASGEACRLNGHSPRSIAHRFKPGQTPPNKGLRRPGWAPGRMAHTQFKKGQMSGAAQHNYVPIGTERISKDGYLERKVTDDQNLAPARRWTGVHRLVWESAHGPVPNGYAVCFLPGRRSIVAEEITADALELVSRVDLMKRNTLHRYPKEVALAIQMKGALQRQINKRERAA